MYLPRSFAETDLAELDRLFQRDAFATLVTVDAEQRPFASHLPLLYHRDGATLRIRGHWARPNPQAQHSGPALLIVHGPHAYVSPSWYADPHQRVPTWNYAVAHLSGQLRRFEDLDALERLVAELAEKYESAIGSDWRFPQSAPSERGDLRGIVGFEFEVSELQLKFKLNQNHPPENVAGAAAALAQGDAQQQEVAAMMRQRLNQRPQSGSSE